MLALSRIPRPHYHLLRLLELLDIEERGMAAENLYDIFFD